MKKESVFPLIWNSFSIVASSYLLVWAFSREQKSEAYDRLNGRCQSCGKAFSFENVYPHHNLPAHMGGSDHKDNLFLCCCNCHPLLDAMTEKSYVCANGLEVTEVGIISPQSVGNKGRYEQVCKKITSIIDGSRKKARKEEKRLRYN